MQLPDKLTAFVVAICSFVSSDVAITGAQKKDDSEGKNESTFCHKGRFFGYGLLNRNVKYTFHFVYTIRGATNKKKTTHKNGWNLLCKPSKLFLRTSLQEILFSI